MGAPYQPGETIMNHQSILARVLCAGAVLYSVGTCANAVAQAPQTIRSVKIAEHQTVTLAPAVSLRYDNVADSRCPKNVQCVAPGKVIHSFTLDSSAGNELFTLEKKGVQYTSNSVPGLTVALAHDPLEENADAQHAVVLDVVIE